MHLPDIWGGHRYVVLTKPNNDGKVVIVNFTSVRDWKDCPVIFRPKDNKSLFGHLTTISCSDATIVSVASLVNEAQDNPKDYLFCSPRNTQKAIIGTLESQLTPMEILDELGTQYPTEYAKYVAAKNISENIPQTP